VAKTPALGTLTLALPRTPKRAPRQAHLTLRATAVTLRPPYRREGKLPPVRVTVIAAIEEPPPPGTQDLWQGLTKLMHVTEAWQHFKQLQ
jgi:hypothetical protein